MFTQLLSKREKKRVVKVLIRLINPDSVRLDRCLFESGQSKNGE